METDSREKTLRMAANVLEYRHRSSRALYQRLLEKGAEEQDAAYAVARLQQLGFLNDGEYGKLLVRDLCRRGYGPARIRQYLKEKQLDARHILYVSHADALEDAKAAAAQLKEAFKEVEIQILELSPVFATQGGPKCVAIQYIER